MQDQRPVWRLRMLPVPRGNLLQWRQALLPSRNPLQRSTTNLRRQQSSGRKSHPPKVRHELSIFNFISNIYSHKTSLDFRINRCRIEPPPELILLIVTFWAWLQKRGMKGEWGLVECLLHIWGDTWCKSCRIFCEILGKNCRSKLSLLFLLPLRLRFEFYGQLWAWMDMMSRIFWSKMSIVCFTAPLKLLKSTRLTAVKAATVPTA